MDTETPTHTSIRCRIESIGRPSSTSGTVAVKVRPDSGPRLVLRVTSVRSMAVTHCVESRGRLQRVERERTTASTAAESAHLLRESIGHPVRITPTSGDPTVICVMSLETIG